VLAASTVAFGAVEIEKWFGRRPERGMVPGSFA
jgi:hypothetical protein